MFFLPGRENIGLSKKPMFLLPPKKCKVKKKWGKIWPQRWKKILKFLFKCDKSVGSDEKSNFGVFDHSLNFLKKSGKRKKKHPMFFLPMFFLPKNLCFFFAYVFSSTFFEEFKKIEEWSKTPESEFSTEPTPLAHSKRLFMIFFHRPSHFFTKLFFTGKLFLHEKWKLLGRKNIGSGRTFFWKFSASSQKTCGGNSGGKFFCH